MEHKGSIVFFLLALLTIIETTAGASPPPSPSTDTTCITSLLVCQTGTSSVMCCDALKSAYNNQLNCLCLLITTESSTSQLGLNGTQISDLLVKCDIVKNGTAICAASPPLPFTPGTPLPFLTPPGIFHTPPPPPNEASVMYKATWIALSGFASLLLFMLFGY